jgi:uncharacterized protein YjbJ (UPF0337 family)
MPDPCGEPNDTDGQRSAVHALMSPERPRGAAGNMRSFAMGEMTDKIAAAGNKLAGNIKEAVGKNTNDEQLVAEGEAQQLKGTGQDVKGSVKGALGDKI